MIAILDYGMGNVRSVANALDVLGCDAEITSDPVRIAESSRVILPGVGSFGDAIRDIQGGGLLEVLRREVLERKKPFLGICLGMQLLMESSSEHGDHAGLGWVSGSVDHLAVGTDRALKVPHVGWNTVTPVRDHPIFVGLTPAQMIFYFVHSYHVVPDDKGVVIGECSHGDDFVAAIAKDNIVAVQFHPEKSQDSGLHLLRNFSTWDA